MEHPDAPAGKDLKYARLEHERRFPLARMPTRPCSRRADIVDRYLSGTRLRLREAVETTATGTRTLRKLTQKIPMHDGAPWLPPEAAAEVTADARFTGGRLARTDRQALLSLLAENGLRPLVADDADLHAGW